MNAEYEIVNFDSSNPILIIHHTKYSSSSVMSHWHMDMEINVLYEGKVDFYVNGQYKVLQKEEICLINSQDIHSSIPHIETDKNSIVGFTLIIKYDFLRMIIPNYSDYFFELDNKNVEKKIIKLMKEISHIYLEKKGISYNLQIIGIVCEILSCLCLKCRREKNLENNDNERVREIIEYVHENYNSVLTGKSVAEKFYFSRSYLSTLFKKYTGKNFKSYLTEIRLLNSEKLLLDTNMTVSEISRIVGFYDERRFIENFKKYYHQTPGNFRKNRARNRR